MDPGNVQSGSFQVYSCIFPPSPPTVFIFLHLSFVRGRVELTVRILSQHVGKTRVAVSMSGTIAQLIGSSSVPLSHDTTRDIILLLCRSVPWFVQIITLNKEGCMSRQSTIHPTATTEKDGEV